MTSSPSTDNAPCTPDPESLEVIARASLQSLYLMMDPSVLPHVRKRIEDYINHLKARAS